jgi:hypothetical protein
MDLATSWSFTPPAGKWTFDQITEFRASTIHRILRRGAVAIP